MSAFLEKLAAVNDAVNGFIWVKIGLVILIATGVVMTASTHFFQLRRLGLWWRKTVGSLFKKEVRKNDKDKK